jgi:branched-chain amino acid transport system substrate-binding protein
VAVLNSMAVILCAPPVGNGAAGSKAGAASGLLETTMALIIAELNLWPGSKQFVERGLDKSGIKLIGPGDITDDELLPNLGDAMLGTITAHFYSAAHPSSTNKSFVASFQQEQGLRPNFMVVSGYDGMHLIYEALRKTNGVTDGDTLLAAMRGLTWESPRGPISIDQRGDVVHNIYVRGVERVGNELYNVEFTTFESVPNPYFVAH